MINGPKEIKPGYVKAQVRSYKTISPNFTNKRRASCAVARVFPNLNVVNIGLRRVRPVNRNVLKAACSGNARWQGRRSHIPAAREGRRRERPTVAKVCDRTDA